MASEWLEQLHQAAILLDDARMQLVMLAERLDLSGMEGIASKVYDGCIPLSRAITHLDRGIGGAVDAYVGAAEDGSRNMLNAALAVCKAGKGQYSAKEEDHAA